MGQLSRCKRVPFLELARIPPAISEENHPVIERYMDIRSMGGKRCKSMGWLKVATTLFTLSVYYLFSVSFFSTV